MTLKELFDDPSNTTIGKVREHFKQIIPEEELHEYKGKGNTPREVVLCLILAGYKNGRRARTQELKNLIISIAESEPERVKDRKKNSGELIKTSENWKNGNDKGALFSNADRLIYDKRGDKSISLVKDLFPENEDQTIEAYWKQVNESEEIDWAKHKEPRSDDDKAQYKKRFLDALIPGNIASGKSTQTFDNIRLYKDLYKNTRNIIFYGPQGTGKTRKAKIDAVKLVTGELDMDDTSALKRAKEIISNQDKDYGGRICLVQFHPSYSYNDFIETIDMTKLTSGSNAGSSGFDDRIFKRFAQEAGDAATEFLNSEDKDEQAGAPIFVLIIDEINRANVAEVLGELLYGLEYRGAEITTGISNSKFSVPDNLYIIGTMNTADRSLQNLDYAVRRRFSFVEVESRNPGAQNKGDETKDFYIIKGDEDNAGEKYFMKKAFDQMKSDITASVARGIEPRDIMPGISYFIVDSKDDSYDKDHFEYKINYELIPLLQEYVKDGMFTKRNMIDTENKKTLIQLVKEKRYYDRLKLLYPEGNINENTD